MADLSKFTSKSREFESSGISSIILNGVAQNSTTAVFYGHLNNGSSVPTSVSITSTLEVFKIGTGSIASGLTAITSISGTTNKVLKITIGGLTGLTQGDPLELRAGTATSKITVNY